MLAAGLATAIAAALSTWWLLLGLAGLMPADRPDPGRSVAVLRAGARSPSSSQTGIVVLAFGAEVAATLGLVVAVPIEPLTGILRLGGEVAAGEDPGHQDQHQGGHRRVLEGRLEGIPLRVQVHDEPVAADHHEPEEEQPEPNGPAEDSVPSLGTCPAIVSAARSRRPRAPPMSSAMPAIASAATIARSARTWTGVAHR
jgi:hypothetical protein